MSISQACWAEIRKRLKPGMRTLEFGSGLSTLLFANHQVEHTAIEDKPEIARDAGAVLQWSDVAMTAGTTGSWRDRTI